VRVGGSEAGELRTLWTQVVQYIFNVSIGSWGATVRLLWLLALITAMLWIALALTVQY
jgi:hypothetical protein